MFFFNKKSIFKPALPLTFCVSKENL